MYTYNSINVGIQQKQSVRLWLRIFLTQNFDCLLVNLRSNMANLIPNLTKPSNVSISISVLLLFTEKNS